MCVLAGLVIGHLLGGPDPDDRTVLALSTATRHPAVALAILHNAPDQKAVMAAVLLVVVVGGIASVPYVKWRTRQSHVNEAIVVIDALALVVVVVGTVEAFISGLRLMVSSPWGHEARDVWLRYGRWLVAGLTFQLAADIIETSITTSWDAVGRIAAIAVIRTFLNFFLERDLAEVRERQEIRGPGAGKR